MGHAVAPLRGFAQSSSGQPIVAWDSGRIRRRAWLRRLARVPDHREREELEHLPRRSAALPSIGVSGAIGSAARAGERTRTAAGGDSRTRRRGSHWPGQSQCAAAPNKRPGSQIAQASLGSSDVRAMGIDASRSDRRRIEIVSTTRNRSAAKKASTVRGTSTARKAARASDAAVMKATGQAWVQWFALLDKRRHASTPSLRSAARPQCTRIAVAVDGRYSPRSPPRPERGWLRGFRLRAVVVANATRGARGRAPGSLG